MAESREEFEARLAALGNLVSSRGVRRATLESLGAIKSAMEEVAGGSFASLLPPWLRRDWEGIAAESAPADARSVVDLLKERGGYPYRAAAERDLTAFFAALRESVAEGAAQEMRPLLPEADRELFDYAASCAYDASVREFL